MPHELGDHRAQNILEDAGVPGARVTSWSYHPKFAPALALALALARAGEDHSRGDSCRPSDSWGPEGGQDWGHRTSPEAGDASFCFVTLSMVTA